MDIVLRVRATIPDTATAIEAADIVMDALADYDPAITIEDTEPAALATLRTDLVAARERVELLERLLCDAETAYAD